MSTNYSDQLDDDLTLPIVEDNITEIGGDAINSLRSAVIAIEKALGINIEGNVLSLNSRISGVIDGNGNLRTSALNSVGLVSLPITNNQIASNAGIEESKLDLDFNTSNLNSQIQSFNSSLDSLQNSIGSVLTQNIQHYNGISNRHDGYMIDLDVSILGASTIEEALNLINNLLSDHLNQNISAHAASSISLEGDFTDIVGGNVQDALVSIEEFGIASLAKHQDELRNNSVTINDKGRDGENGNLNETTYAATIYQTDTAKATNILQIMRPNVARITGTQPDLRALSTGAIQNLRIFAGGIDRSALDIDLSAIIPTQDLNDVIVEINEQFATNHYPVSAYNTSGKLTLAHNLPGLDFTIEVQSGVTLSAHTALGLEADVTIDWAGNNYSAFINGKRITDIKSLIKTSLTHAGGTTISPALGDLNVLGLTTDANGRVLVQITNHDTDSTQNGTYYITSFPNNSTFTLSDSIAAGTFDLEVASDSTNFQNASNGQIFDIFVEPDTDGYSTISKTKRVEYGKLTGVSLSAVSEAFTTDALNWQVTADKEIQFLGGTNDGELTPVPNGFRGQLKIFSADNVSLATFEVDNNLQTGSRSLTVDAFDGNNQKLHICSVHYSGNFGLTALRFVTDRRNFGGAPENFTNNTFERIPLEQNTNDLRSNGVVRGFDLISSTSSDFLIRGGSAYVEGRKVNVISTTITVKDFTAGTNLLLLNRNGNFTIEASERKETATILQFDTDGASITSDSFIDLRLILADIDKQVQTIMQEGISVSVKRFGAVGDGVTDDTTAILDTINYVDSFGGGQVFFPAGTYATSTGIIVGNGSDSAPSSIHNKVRLAGAGYGGSTGLINQQINGASRILYTGGIDASASVLTFAGPMYGIGAENLTLDCDSKAGRGLIVNHVTMGTFNRISSRNYTTIGFDLTTRTGFPSGCAFGNADNRFYECYGWVDDASLASSTIIGISLNSGVSTGTSLVGNPDSARNVFIGGTFFYGTTASSYGAYLSGADNNTFIETQFFPYGGSTSGYDVYLNQWPASGNWPSENYFSNLGMTRGVSGNGGVGSSFGNTFFPFTTGDGASFPALTGTSGVDHTGKTYVAGVRAYRNRQSDSASINGSVQSNSTTSLVNVPGLAVTLTTLASSKLRVSFSGRAAKSTTGLGYFIIAVDGLGQGETRTDVNADGVWHAVSGEGLYAVGSGSHTVTAQFASGDTNAIQISHGSIVVEELY